MKLCEETGIYYLDDYYPYRVFDEYGNKIINSKFSKKNGGYILDIKNNLDEGINYYTNKILKELEKARHMDRLNIIMYVPSSQAGKQSCGIRKVLENIVNQYKHVKLLDCLERKETINKLAKGGNRDINIHLNSIILKSSLDEIKNKNIFIFDDVTTTGNSLLACKSIVEKYNPNAVLCIALAKTISLNLR